MEKEVRRFVLEEILTEDQIHHILKRSIGDDVPCTLKCSEVRPAVDGIAGFLGEHMKAILHVDVQGQEKRLHLFLKRIPIDNKPKAEIIDNLNFYRREVLMYKILEEILVQDSNKWSEMAYIYTDTIVVMPDLTLEGYTTQHFLNTLDYDHIFTASTSIAQFHAACVNYETKKSIDLKRPYSIYKEYENVMAETSWRDTLWMSSCAKLSANIFKKFSTKLYRNMPDLESKLTDLFLSAYDTMAELNKDTLNTIIHTDLWVNNILFKHENGVPTSAILIDFQCLRYGPPALDLIIFLYLTTDKKLRQDIEKDIFDNYYSIFVKNLKDDSKKRLNDIGYDKIVFLSWCEKSRKFGMLQALCLYPLVLMDPKSAQKTFDDPETYEKILADRSEPVIQYAYKCDTYRQRNLAAVEEFVENFVLS